jgi:multicomponent Na+:H+ antiporter subunit D
MVELGVYAVARLYWVIFAGALGPHADAVRVILIAAGTLTALLGAWMCVMQRHIKRLLAFSTISHVGVFVCGVGLLSAKAIAGVALYIAGHGLTKAALFMCTGVLLHRFRTVDEFDLHGRGRVLPKVGIVWAIGGLLLCALPPFTAYHGKSLLDEASGDAGFAWLTGLFIVVSALTGGAVLRVAGRVFLGWGPQEAPKDIQERAAEERVDETRDEAGHTPPLMVIVPAVLLLGAFVVGLIPGASDYLLRAARQFTANHAYVGWVLHGHLPRLPPPPQEHSGLLEWLSGFAATLGALLIAWVGLFGRPLRERVPKSALRFTAGVRALHSGHIGDYIAWWTAGVAVVGSVCLLTL